MAVKVTDALIDMLNKGVAREFQVAVQYILQHMKMEKILRKVRQENILLDKTTYDAIGGILKKMAIEEMKHAGKIMERIYYLGAEATTRSEKPHIGETLKDFMTYGFKAEEEALELYRQTIVEAEKIGDYETAMMFRAIYQDEEKHLYSFEEFKNVDISEPEGPGDVKVEHTSVYTPEYFALLNKAVAAEISAIVQYTNQHEKASKLALRKKESPLEVIGDTNKAKVVSELLKRFFMQEMKHLELIAERVYLLGGDSVYNPDPLPEVGGTVDDFLKLDKKAEDYAIGLYRKIIGEAERIGDIVTRRIFESIIEDEDKHFWELDDYF
nr:ferritin-like domain-containing protein [Candidatus Sigynarchaeota archaeon]